MEDMELQLADVIYVVGDVVEANLDKDSEEDLSAQDLIDFSPVYRCLHIYSVLSSRDIFETYYRKQRKKQARLVLQPPTNMVWCSSSRLCQNMSQCVTVITLMLIL